MKSFLQYLEERKIINPDVSFVGQGLSKINPDDLIDSYDFIDSLNAVFEPQVTFELVARGNFGSGVFKDKLSAHTGIAGAKYNGPDDDYEITVLITKRALGTFVKEPNVFEDRLKQIIKHELIHKAQTERAGKDLGASADGDQYYFDSHEVHAIVSEIETQLLQIEPDRDKLITMIQKLDPKLNKSDRWRLYVNLVKERPEFRKSFNQVIKELILRLQ